MSDIALKIMICFFGFECSFIRYFINRCLELYMSTLLTKRKNAITRTIVKRISSKTAELSTNIFRTPKSNQGGRFNNTSNAETKDVIIEIVRNVLRGSDLNNSTTMLELYFSSSVMST